ncbi:MAG: SAM-dependent methyltransferase [Actinomycetota bacterium]
MTRSGPASELVLATIEADGPLRFDRYVELCLYGEDVGFFATGGGAGRQGRDFVTSPEVGPLFGRLLATAIDRWWEHLGRPHPFAVVEAGAGRGTLARTILAAEPSCGPALDLVLVETSSSLRAEHPDGVRSLAELPDQVGIGLVLANELLDNLPPRVAVRTQDGWSELHVGVEGDALVEVLVPPVEPVPALDAPVGARVPVQTAAASWVVRALDLVDAGAVIAIDYTSATAELAVRPWTDWLRTYAGHRRGGPPLDVPGAQDITCDVCIDQLPTPTAVTSQADHLRLLGLDALVDEGRQIWAERAHLGDLQAMVARSRIAESDALVDPTGLGAFSVMEWVASGDRPPTMRP